MTRVGSLSLTESLIWGCHQSSGAILFSAPSPVLHEEKAELPGTGQRAPAPYQADTGHYNWAFKTLIFSPGIHVCLERRSAQSLRVGLPDLGSLAEKQAKLEHSICRCQPWGHGGTRGPPYGDLLIIVPGGWQGLLFFQCPENKCQNVRQEDRHSLQTSGTPPFPQSYTARRARLGLMCAQLKPKLRCAF